MTSTRKVKLHDRGTPEPKPSRKVVLDELLRSLQDLVTNELAVDVPLDAGPAPADAPATAATTTPPAVDPLPTPPSPKRHDGAAPLKDEGPAWADAPATAATTTPPAVDPLPTPPSPKRHDRAAPVKPEAQKPGLRTTDIIADTRAENLDVEAEAATPVPEPGPPDQIIDPAIAKSTAKPGAAPASIPEPGPVVPVVDARTAPAAPESRTAMPVSKPMPAGPVIEPKTPARERKSAPPPPDPAMLPPRRGRLGDTVVLTPRPEIPAAPAASSKRGARRAMVETPVPPGGLQQDLPYLDVSPPPRGQTANPVDAGPRKAPRVGTSNRRTFPPPAADVPDPPAAVRAGIDLLIEPTIEIPERPAAGVAAARPAAPEPATRASAMESDGPNELPDLDYSAAPAAAAPRANMPLTLVDDNAGPSDIPLLEDAVNLDDLLEPPAAAPPGPASATPPAVPGGARRLAIQIAARLNVDLRRQGKPVLGSDVIARLAKLLEESLANGAPNMENTRPKKH